MAVGPDAGASVIEDTPAKSEVCPEEADNGCTTNKKEADMRLFTTHKRGSRHTTSHPGERTLRDILTGPDTAHRRELETMIEDSSR